MKLLTVFLLLHLPFSAEISPDSTESQRLHAIFSDFQQRSQSDWPSDAEGERTPPKLPDASIASIEKTYAQNLRFLERLESVVYDSLNVADQINFRLFDRILREAVEAFELGHHHLPLNGWWDYHATLAELGNRAEFRTTKDYTDYISRLRSFADQNEQYISRLRTAIEKGWVRPRVVLENYIPTIEALVVPPREHRLFEPFTKFPDAIPRAMQIELQREGFLVLSRIVIPELERLARFMREEYYPAAPEAIAISELDGGRAYYDHLVRHYTTLDITPEEIHEIGLAEVARIRQEMLAVIKETGFEGDFDEFVHFLRTDPRFYATSPEELLQVTALVLKRMDGELPRYFKRLPRMPYGLKEVPDYMAPRMTTAYYNSPERDGTRAGFYFVNTYDLPSRPLYEVEALSFHEAVPGHHLQLALQQELTGLPGFRRTSGFTVFVEGWALYSEWLALEMGFYKDPYSNFGRLTYEMWRALRLVVDPGMHALGWSREAAIEFMAANSALTLLNIRNEVDRYIFWPGQALAYKTGEIKIKELRKLAEESLGTSFDIREFHDVVLRNGSITLEVLEEEVLRWISQVKSES